MKPVLLVIENDYSLDEAYYVKYFMKEYKGEIIELTKFAQRSKEEIFKAVSQCTDIAVQTCFVNGSDNQLYGMVKLLSAIKHPINVYIAYLGISYQNELYTYLVENLDPEDLLSIAHHNIYAMSRDRYESVASGEPHLLLDFESVTRKPRQTRSKKAVHALYIQHYKDTARSRTTGRKVLVLGCTAYGEAFKNLPIGDEVDELICNKLLTGKAPARGIWIWGNGEPIMLVNDNGFREYQFMTKLGSEGILKEIGRLVNQDKKFKKLKELTLRGLLHVIEDDGEYPLGKANLICELLKIPKRGNRQNIVTLLEENLPVSV